MDSLLETYAMSLHVDDIVACANTLSASVPSTLTRENIRVVQDMFLLARTRAVQACYANAARSHALLATRAMSLFCAAEHSVDHEQWVIRLLVLNACHRDTPRGSAAVIFSALARIVSPENAHAVDALMVRHRFPAAVRALVTASPVPIPSLVSFLFAFANAVYHTHLPAAVFANPDFLRLHIDALPDSPGLDAALLIETVEAIVIMQDTTAVYTHTRAPLFSALVAPDDLNRIVAACTPDTSISLLNMLLSVVRIGAHTREYTSHGQTPAEWVRSLVAWDKACDLLNAAACHNLVAAHEFAAALMALAKYDCVPKARAETYVTSLFFAMMGDADSEAAEIMLGLMTLLLDSIHTNTRLFHMLLQFKFSFESDVYLVHSYVHLVDEWTWKLQHRVRSECVLDQVFTQRMWNYAFRNPRLHARMQAYKYSHQCNTLALKCIHILDRYSPKTRYDEEYRYLFVTT